jgi:phage head maturation protease
MKGTGGERNALLSAHPKDGDRAFVLWTSGCQVTQNTGEAWTLDVDEEACDLSTLNSGTAPVLVQHQRHVDDVIGIVEEAWIEDALGYAVVRFGRRARAQEIRLDVEAGILRNCSVGFKIMECEEPPDSTIDARHYRATRWKPFEISLVAVGADSRTRISTTEKDKSELLDLLKARRSTRLAAARLRVSSLHDAGEIWRAWASTVAGDLATEFGVCPDRAAAFLRERVERNLEKISG